MQIAHHAVLQGSHSSLIRVCILADHRRQGPGDAPAHSHRLHMCGAGWSFWWRDVIVGSKLSAVGRVLPPVFVMRITAVCCSQTPQLSFPAILPGLLLASTDALLSRVLLLSSGFDNASQAVSCLQEA